MVYAVCTPEPEETVEVVKSFLSAHPAFHVECEEQVPEPVRSILNSDGFLQTYPNLRYIDYFFAVRLRRVV
jgi:16S rRNA C967 or C1407 C5-methylase (RsmB/RsmF family)